MRPRQPLTTRQLIRATRKHFGLKRDYEPLIQIHWYGNWQVLNLSDFRTVTKEQLAFMCDLLNGVDI